MKKPLLITLCYSLFSVSVFFSCQSEPAAEEKTEQPVQKADPYAHISDGQAKDLLKKAIESAGGLDNWKAIKDIRFKKYFALYTETGETENEALQNHHYQFKPNRKVQISWVKDEDKHLLDFENGMPQKSINGKADPEANAESLTNSVLSATFVVSIPFNLLDPGVKLSYDGPDTLYNGLAVEVLRAVYDPDTSDNHSTPDTWWHYFDAENHLSVGYMVQHADHYSFVENIELAEAGGFSFPKVRKSYRADSQRNLKYLRADYDYGEYTVD